LTLDQFAEITGVGRTRLAAAESAQGANLTMETMVKITAAMGIARPAYLIDPEVFREVNRELDLVKALRERGATSMALRASSAAGGATPELADLLATMITVGEEARRLQARAESSPEP